MSSVNSYRRFDIDLNINTCLYLCISIGSVTPTGDRNKHKLEISIRTCISSVQYTRNPNKNKI